MKKVSKLKLFFLFVTRNTNLCSHAKKLVNKFDLGENESF